MAQTGRPSSSQTGSPSVDRLAVRCIANETYTKFIFVNLASLVSDHAKLFGKPTYSCISYESLKVWYHAKLLANQHTPCISYESLKVWYRAKLFGKATHLYVGSK